MPIWIASYPRSGNTFLRIVLKQAFDFQTASVYENDLRFFDKTPELISTIGHVEAAGQNTFDASSLIKTHNSPVNDDAAIYVMRDGRAAVVSFYHYLRDIEKSEVSIEDVIAGPISVGGWSQHIAAWHPKTRKRTLLVRYEDMLSSIPSVIDQISNFLEVKPLRAPIINFTDLHKLHPNFFRSGGNEAAFEEIATHRELFDQYHGETMQEYGYYSDATRYGRRTTRVEDESQIAARQVAEVTHEAITTERDAARIKTEAEITARQTAEAERNAAAAEREVARAAAEDMRRERDAAWAECETAIDARQAMESDRDAAVAERDATQITSDALRLERDAAQVEAEAAVEARRLAETERDAAAAEREVARAATDDMRRERDAARDAAAAASQAQRTAECERDAAQIEAEAAIEARRLAETTRDAAAAEREVARAAADDVRHERDAARAAIAAASRAQRTAETERDAAAAERDATRSAIDRVSQEGDAMRTASASALTAALTERDAAAADRDAARSDVALAQGTQRLLEAERDAAHAGQAAAEHARERAESRYSAFLHWSVAFHDSTAASLSWKLTRPLRWLRIGRPKRPPMPDV